MSKKLHDIDFERTMIEKNKHAILFKVNIPQFNSLDFDILLFPKNGYLTLYRKVPDLYGKSVRIYYVNSFEVEKIQTGEVVFDSSMITYFRSDDEEYFTPGGMIHGPTGQFTLNNMIIGWPSGKIGYEGNPDDCSFKNHKEPIFVNDDGEKIKVRKRIPANEILGVTLKVKEYCHTGWLK